ncbi:MAG: GNAT family protein [Patescibacteria group bacterium]|nr:GNAT family protein [Patescibacteria group bacterium]
MSKIKLIPLTQNDKEKFYLLATQSDGSNFWYDNKQKEKRSKKSFFNDWKPTYFDEENTFEGQCFWIVSDERKVGAVCYNPIDKHNQRTELDIIIGNKNDWGKGFGSQAIAAILNYLFQDLKLNKIWIEARANNPRAVAAYEKVGFKVEGKLKEQDYFNGEFVDCVRLGILRDEWIN